MSTQMQLQLEAMTKTVPFLYSHKGGEETEPFEFDDVRLPLLLILLVICSYARGLKSSSSSSSSNPSSFVPTDGRNDGNSMKSFSLNSLLLLLALGGIGGGWAMPDVLRGELIPLLDPVLKLSRFPFSC
jgi:hypothetical protein